MSLKSDIELKSYGTLDDNPKIEKPQGIYQNTLLYLYFDMYLQDVGEYDILL